MRIYSLNILNFWLSLSYFSSTVLSHFKSLFLYFTEDLKMGIQITSWVLCMNVLLTFHYWKCQIFRSGHNSTLTATYLWPSFYSYQLWAVVLHVYVIWAIVTLSHPIRQHSSCTCLSACWWGADMLAVSCGCGYLSGSLSFLSSSINCSILF